TEKANKQARRKKTFWRGLSLKTYGIQKIYRTSMISSVLFSGDQFIAYSTKAHGDPMPDLTSLRTGRKELHSFSEGFSLLTSGEQRTGKRRTARRASKLPQSRRKNKSCSSGPRLGT
uniref:Uncharacterized protein n=1 Tax=Apteryx owenii TaxID=8824 RepID=A0A8B9QIJ1_APTOW